MTFYSVGKNILLSMIYSLLFFGYFFCVNSVYSQDISSKNRSEYLQSFQFKKPNFYKLKNGLILIIDTDKRSPVVDHTIWYRVGSADEKEGESGIAHFLEHLMFRGTNKYQAGYFSKRISQIGGNDNAFTTHDLTAYYQNIPNVYLKEVMQMESNRMRHIKISEKELLKERDIVLEERFLRVDTAPTSQLLEQMNALLFRNHPYGKPVIGWQHEISQLNKQQVMAFYKKYYAPNNAIVTVVGDVNPDDVYQMAQDTYGKINASEYINAQRIRPQEPPQIGIREITLQHKNVTSESLFFTFQDITNTKNDNQKFSLIVALNAIAGGPHSILDKKLVKEQKVALSVNSYLNLDGLDKGSVVFQLIPAAGISLKKLRKIFENEIQNILNTGFNLKDINREKNALLTGYISAFDSRTNRSYFWGENVALGKSIPQIIDFPQQVSSVTSEDAHKILKAILLPNNQVWGYLKMVQ
jgi:zinc protease